MKVLVVGASGVVGASLVPQLVARGHEVMATGRNPERLERLRTMGAQAALLDGLDAPAVNDTVHRFAPEAIVNQMTALSGKVDLRRFDRWLAPTNELRARGTDNLLAAAQAAGVRRLVTQSFTGWINDDSGGPIKSEDDPLDPDPLPQQRAALEAIQHMEQAVLAAPLVGVVLRYATLYGPGASDESVALLRKRMFPIIGDGAGIWSWVHADDAASATVAAVEGGPPGVYNVADDDPAPVHEWLPHLAQVVGAPKPMRVPVWLGRLVAGEVAVRMMTRVRGSSNAKAKAQLGWRPTWASWRDGFRTLVA